MCILTHNFIKHRQHRLNCVNSVIIIMSLYIYVRQRTPHNARSGTWSD